MFNKFLRLCYKFPKHLLRQISKMTRPVMNLNIRSPTLSFSFVTLNSNFYTYKTFCFKKGNFEVIRKLLL